MSLGTLTTIPGRGAGNKQAWPVPEEMWEGNRPATDLDQEALQSSSQG